MFTTMAVFIFKSSLQRIRRSSEVFVLILSDFVCNSLHFVFCKMFECCVCKSSRQDAILHHFPCTEKRLNMWLKCLNRDDLKKLPPEQLSKLLICQKHFEARFITSKSRLVGRAYPSLFTEDEIASGIPSKDNAENVQPQIEHNYSRKRHFDHTYYKTTYRPEPLQELIVVSCDFENLPGTSQQPPTTHDSENVQPQNEVNYSRKRHFDHTYYKTTYRPEPLQELIVESREFENLPGTSQQPPTMHDSDIIASESCVFHPEALQEAHTCHSSEIIVSDSSIFQSLPGTSQIPLASQKLGLDKATCSKAPKASKKRLVNKIKNLTPTGQIIYNEYKKAKQQTDYFRRAKRASKLSKTQMFEKISKNMNPYAKKIMEMQMNLCTKKKKGRRFSMEEKLIALSVMKQSPKAYRFLHKIFILPSRSTLNKMVTKLNVQTGICPQVFNLIKKEVSTWNEKKKCSIIFDEMSLESGLTYDDKKDNINGFVELEEKKTNLPTMP